MRLCDAAGDGDDDATPGERSRLLEHAQLAELGIDLLRGALADIAGVENDEIGAFGVGDFGEPGRRQRVSHTMRIVDVHLAAEGFDVKFSQSVHAVLLDPERLIYLLRPGLSPPDRLLISQRIHDGEVCLRHS